MARIIFTVNAEMQEDLEKEAKERGATVSGLIRLILAEALASKTGKDADMYRVEHGGNRQSTED